jgi:radical SAM enzyme (TIGR01210 family)
VTSVYPEQARTKWISAQRPARTAGLDPFKPHGFFLEEERSCSGEILSSLTILLTNKECPWRCLMCDLWKNTLTHTVPPGAIPAQIDYALGRFASLPQQIKLYNSGSFFDPAAIPAGDYAAIAKKVSLAQRVIVESHPRVIGEKAIQLRDLLNDPTIQHSNGSTVQLEVAMGLETVHPEVLPRLNKKFSLAHFAQAAEFLRNTGIDARAFVLVKPPFLAEADAVKWAVRSVEFAFGCGATVVSLIPTRAGNGAMERLMESGEFSPPRLSTLESALAACLKLNGGRVFADLWNLEQFSICKNCFESRRARLYEMNLTQQALAPIGCSFCTG